VEAATCAWLTAQKSGTVIPQGLACALNDKILLNLGSCLLKPLSVRTARHWLIRLGWRRTVVQKGIYKDGHERGDVVLYQTNVFLPTMAKYEACMATYDGLSQTMKLPTLSPGEKRVL
jgi:hypothetical protein